MKTTRPDDDLATVVTNASSVTGARRRTLELDIPSSLGA